MEIVLRKDNGKVRKAQCNCPAGKSGYCNHIMALLFEVADYSLHQLKKVPDEIACTSTSRQWGIPSDNTKYPMPVMDISIQKQENSKGVECTLYNPRKNADKDNLMERTAQTYLNFVLEDKRIGYGHIINYSLPKVSTANGDFFTGSTAHNPDRATLA